MEEGNIFKKHTIFFISSFSFMGRMQKSQRTTGKGMHANTSKTCCISQGAAVCVSGQAGERLCVLLGGLGRGCVLAGGPRRGCVC